MKKFIIIFVLLLLVAGSGYLYFSYFFVFGEGVKSGRINFVVHKGYLFKTYEGRIIQDGLKSDKPGLLQSNEFDFSISNKELAEQLMRSSGQSVDLVYKEYKRAVPWRGNSHYVVDSMLVHDTPEPPVVQPDTHIEYNAPDQPQATSPEDSHTVEM